MPIITALADATPPPTSIDWSMVAVLAIAAATVGFAWWRGLLKPGSLGRDPATRDVHGLSPGQWFVWSGIAMAAHFFLIQTICLALVAVYNQLVKPPLDPYANEFLLTTAGMTMMGLSMLIVTPLIWFALAKAPTFRLPASNRVAHSKRFVSPAPRDLRLPANKTASLPWLRVRGMDVLVGTMLVIPAFAITMTAGLASSIIWQLLQQEAPPELAHKALAPLLADGWDAWRIGAVAMIVLGAPLAEEVLFRGVLQSTLLSITRSPWTSVLATGLFFGLVHVNSTHPATIPGLCLFGVFLGIVMERRRSLAACVALHAGFNGLTLILAHFLAAR